MGREIGCSRSDTARIAMVREYRRRNLRKGVNNTDKKDEAFKGREYGDSWELEGISSDSPPVGFHASDLPLQTSPEVGSCQVNPKLF